MAKDYFVKADGSDELACSCGCGLTIRTSTRARLNRVRERFGKPISAAGARCPNNLFYSGHTSSHGDREDEGFTPPCAIDIMNTSKSDRKEILEIAIDEGFVRWGIGNNQLHIDDDESKPVTYWIYS